MSRNVELAIMFVFVNKKALFAVIHCCTMIKEGNPKVSSFFKICFKIWPLTFLDFLRFLLPSETTGSSVSTKSKSQMSMCGSIVPTATKLPMDEKW